MNRRSKSCDQLYRMRWRIIFLLPICSCVAAQATDLVPTDIMPPADIVQPPADAVTPYAGYSVGYDSNLLRLQNSAAAQAMGLGSDLSDTTQRYLFGLAVDKTLSRQHLTANLNVTKVDYDHFGELDHYDKNMAANWNWHAGDHFEGNIGANYSQGLTPFIDFHLLERNIRTEESAYADGSWLFHPSWRVRGGLTYTKLKYDLVSQQPLDNTRNQSELGLDYLAASGSTIGLQLRHTHADFPTPELDNGVLVLNGYNQDEVKAKIDWLLSGKTQLHFLGGWVSRTQDASQVSNFSGINTRLSADWSPTGKIQLTVAGWREIGAVDDLSTVYSLNHGASLASAWQYSEKIQLVAQYKYQKRDFGQSAGTGTLGSLNQNDVLRDTALSVVYNPTQRWRVQLSGIRSTQTLKSGAGGFVSNGVTLNTRYAF